MSHNDNDKIRDSSTVSNPPLSNLLFEALGKIIFDRKKIVFGGFNIGCSQVGSFNTRIFYFLKKNNIWCLKGNFGVSESADRFVVVSRKLQQ